MKQIPIAGIRVNSTCIAVAEALPESEASKSHIQLKVGTEELHLSLDDIQGFKVLLSRAERRLLDRQEQALLARNLSLDL